MCRSSSRVKLSLAAIAVFVGVAWHTPVWAAPTTPWDQARVAGIAERLAEAADKLYDQEYKAPQSYTPGTFGGGNAHHEFMDRLRRLKHETHHLASSLEKGASAKATRGSVEHIEELNDALTEYGRMIESVDPVLNQLAAFESLIRQITPYYGLDEKH